MISHAPVFPCGRCAKPHASILRCTRFFMRPCTAQVAETREAKQLMMNETGALLLLELLDSDNAQVEGGGEREKGVALCREGV